MKSLPHLFQNNRSWSTSMRDQDPDYFTKLLGQQDPDYLWIGCSDSRVPSNQIVGLPPGELFVHRNVANVVAHADLNCLSVMQYAVDVLEVGHIIVCGHYGCGGVLAALGDDSNGLVDNWLRAVRDVRFRHHDQLADLPDDVARHKRLCELNVIEQVINTGQTTIVGDAWNRGQPLIIHGWIYDLADGLLRDLGISAGSHAELRACQQATRP